ncbi:LAT2 domain-containing protein [Plectropomus leopardus]|uniref:LAT2 domain-containing protein n=1 Tax=Plectropomus leopardus TaxID=160734 RepID=UPI001C4D83C6|nr:LAT2 domain-containing protein [Plectropomus leopardus]
MIENSSVLAAVLTVVSVLSLSLMSVLCLRCKKKSKIIHEEHQIYDPQPQTFLRGGSMFAVTQSKTVTRANQITSTTVEIQENFEDLSTAANDEQSDYQNISDAQTGGPEHTYVDPLPISVYENEKTGSRLTDAGETPGVYENIITSLAIKDDDDDYENSDFLGRVQEQEDDEPDYVNENG